MAVLPYSDPVIVQLVDHVLPFSDPVVVHLIPPPSEWRLPDGAGGFEYGKLIAPNG